ncbi:MAG: redoxin domain-containing protein [Saprospiraceae bacterium]
MIKKYFGLIFLLISFQINAAEDVKTLEIGASAPDFSLKGTDGKMYSLKSFATANILVVLFSCNHCPTAQAYEDRIIKFVNDYKSKNVKLVAISPNSDKSVRWDEMGYTDISDSYQEMQIRAKDKKYNFSYLYDGATQATSHKYGAIATPHVFIFDKSRKLKYQGRIDDNEHIGKETVHNLRDAVDALLMNKPIEPATTKVFGCSVKWAEKSASKIAEVAKWATEPVTLEKADIPAIKELVQNKGNKKYRLINVWATWCGPCVAEFTSLVESNHMYRRRDFEFVSVSMDAPKNEDKALAFLKEKYASNKNLIYDGTDKYALIEAVDPKWQGALPYTILVSPEGKIVHQQMGQIDVIKLRKAIADHIGRYYD